MCVCSVHVGSRHVCFMPVCALCALCCNFGMTASAACASIMQLTNEHQVLKLKER